MAKLTVPLCSRIDNREIVMGLFLAWCLAQPQILASIKRTLSDPCDIFWALLRE